MRYLFSILLIGLFACNSKKERTTNSVSSEDSIIQDSIAQVEYSYHLYKKRLNHIGEIDLIASENVGYRYIYTMAFDAFSFYFTVLEDSNFTAQLSTKFVANHRPGVDSTFVNWDNGFYIYHDTVISSSSQKLNNEEYSWFLGILYGSYFWALDPKPYTPLGTDGSNLLLESKFKVDGNSLQDTLIYHSVNIHIPLEGSFVAACRYLAKISILPIADVVVEIELKENKQPHIERFLY